MDYSDMRRQAHQAKLATITTQARAEHDTMHKGLSPWQEELAIALVKYQSLAKASKAVSVSRENTLQSFHNPAFRSRIEELYHAEIVKALEIARYQRDRAELLSSKDSETRSLINRLSKNITYCLERQYYLCNDIFPELKVLL